MIKIRIILISNQITIISCRQFLGHCYKQNVLSYTNEVSSKANIGDFKMDKTIKTLITIYLTGINGFLP